MPLRKLKSQAAQVPPPNLPTLTIEIFLRRLRLLIEWNVILIPLLFLNLVVRPLKLLTAARVRIRTVENVKVL